MGRRALPYKTKLTRAMVRLEYLQSVRGLLAKQNLFNPTKPEHGAYSQLVEQLLYEWLRERLEEEDFSKLPERLVSKL